MKEINFNVEDIEKIDLSMDVGIKEIYPPLENLEVVPTKQKQIFNHENSYGYDNVTINPISDEYIIPSGTLPITENTTYDVRKYARVSASVHPAPNLQDKEVVPTKEIQNIKSDEEYDGLDAVVVNPIPDEYIIPSLEGKVITPTKETQTVAPSEGWDGLSQVTVNAIPDEYIVPSGELEITESGTYDVTEYASANVNVASSGSGGGIPVFCGGGLGSGLTGVTSASIPNSTLAFPKGTYPAQNVASYKQTPDLALIFCFVRGGTTYEVSSNLMVIAETDWAIHTGDNLMQKLIVAKADLTSTDNYIITQATSGRMQYGYCYFYRAGEPEVVTNMVGGMEDTKIMTSSPDSDLYLYIGSSIYSAGTSNLNGMLKETSKGDFTYVDNKDRLFYCWTDRQTDLEFVIRPSTPCYQFLCLKLPYKGV